METRVSELNNGQYIVERVKRGRWSSVGDPFTEKEGAIQAAVALVEEYNGSQIKRTVWNSRE